MIQIQQEAATDTLLGKSIVVTCLNLPSQHITLCLSDGTADKQLLEHAIGSEIMDVTPDGQLKLAHEVVQYPTDITRTKSKTRAQDLVRGVLASRPQRKRVGVITHQTLVKDIQELGAPFEDRIVLVRHFGSGADRGSNEWHRAGCDLIIVAGTPRVPPSEISQQLFRCGELEALRNDGQWGELNWVGFTTAGGKRIVNGRGYQDPTWRQIHRSKVRANIIQAAGRARSLLESGCEAVILSNEEMGFPLVDAGQDVEPMTEQEQAVFANLSEVYANKYLRNGFRCATSVEVAARCGLTDRQTREMLTRLERRGMACRIGQRGGWLPAEAWMPNREGQTC